MKRQEYIILNILDEESVTSEVVKSLQEKNIKCIIINLYNISFLLQVKLLFCNKVRKNYKKREKKLGTTIFSRSVIVMLCFIIFNWITSLPTYLK